ncbi:hypothetical protein N7603_07340 [Acholeplasma vituli]|uniref:DUF3899 domain-containing protein n=1 Tax=Paracholeplasma vituli TaxID=69473 RepID=A0ABT2PYN6_9MOLU|nr:hypothetical protein [Paracholeplasma vituli]MCU0105469.1 hypothetical protein [Paracholeplasma vituli]
MKDVKNKKILTAAQQLKKQKQKRNLKAALVMTVISVVLVGFGLLWQWELSLRSIGDAFWLAFAIELTMAWTMFVYNENILSPLIHGTRTFLSMIVGKRPKESYFEYTMRINDNQIPKFYYIVGFLSALAMLIPALITLFMQL